MDEIKKENFDLKLRVDSLQERLNRAAPGNIEATITENVNLRVTNEALEGRDPDIQTDGRRGKHGSGGGKAACKNSVEQECK